MMQPCDKIKELNKQIGDKIANYHIDEEFDEELVKLADRALETLKNNGNNNTTNIR